MYIIEVYKKRSIFYEETNKNFKFYILFMYGQCIVISYIIKRYRSRTKKNTFYVTSKKGIEVKVIMKFKYGKPYKDYKRNTVVDGPQIHLAGNSKAWSSSTYYKEDKKGNTVPVMLVYTKTLKKKGR